MPYLTDRKRAVGKGASRTGTQHHWFMQVSAVALALLVPTWLILFGGVLGASREAAWEFFSRPVPAILTGLLWVVGAKHFISGATMMLEDYTQGSSRKIAIISVTLLAWTIAATGLFALVRIAL